MVYKQEQPSSLISDLIEKINIRSKEQPKILQIGSTLWKEENSKLINLL